MNEKVVALGRELQRIEFSWSHVSAIKERGNPLVVVITKCSLRDIKGGHRHDHLNYTL